MNILEIKKQTIAIYTITQRVINGKKKVIYRTYIITKR